MESKRYRLKKDLPDSNAGDEYVLFRDGIEGPSVYYKYGDPNEIYWLQKHVENQPDWFELIEEVKPTGTKDVFTWTDELIKDFLTSEYSRIKKGYIPWQEIIDDFKQSKQSLKPDSKERIEVRLERQTHSDPRIKPIELIIVPTHGVAEWQLSLLKDSIERVLNNETGESQFRELIFNYSNEKLIEFVIRLKEYCVREQKFEPAATFRSIERILRKSEIDHTSNFDGKVYTQQQYNEAIVNAFESAKQTIADPSNIHQLVYKFPTIESYLTSISNNK